MLKKHAAHLFVNRNYSLGGHGKGVFRAPKLVRVQ